MWSPDSRKQRAAELEVLSKRITRYRQLTERFAGYFNANSDTAQQLLELRPNLEHLQKRADDRQKRLAKGVVKIGVAGLEKQGKSAFLSAWLKCEGLLPSEAERCTWSTTVVEPSVEGEYGAVVEYYSRDQFQHRITSYFDALELGSAGNWEQLDESELERLRKSYRARRGHDIDDHDRAGSIETAAFAELREISRHLGEIKARLGREPYTLEASSLDELKEKIRPFIALKDTRAGNRPYADVRAVKLVRVTIPVTGAMPGVVLMDLPGIDAPSDKARRDTEEALTNEVDVTVFVKDITRPSLVKQENDLLNTMQRADSSIALRDRLFVVLTKVDLFKGTDENGNWNWRLAANEFADRGQVFPYSKVWAHQGVDLRHPVAYAIQEYYRSPEPVHGLEMLEAAIAQYLVSDLERLDQASVESIRREFSVLEAKLRGPLEAVKSSINPKHFEDESTELFEKLWHHVVSGDKPEGLFPSIRKSLNQFTNDEMSPEKCKERATLANKHISSMRDKLLQVLTPEAAEECRLQLRVPVLINEGEVEKKLRERLDELLDSSIDGIGEGFRVSARTSIEGMLVKIFRSTEYKEGRLERLLPPGNGPILDRLKHASEASEIVTHHRKDLDRAEIAFEVLARYFARQIRGILLATGESDRTKREAEMVELERFFNIEISQGRPRGPQQGMGGGPFGGPAAGGPFGGRSPLQKPVDALVEGIRTMGGREPASGASPAASAPGATASHDWSKMLERVRIDVERICAFLEALAQHQSGLQKFHEEVVLTAHSTWLGREGESLLSRWARRHREQIWPTQFAAIETKAKRAREDIRALEELFSAEAR